MLQHVIGPHRLDHHHTVSDYREVFSTRLEDADKPVVAADHLRPPRRNPITPTLETQQPTASSPNTAFAPQKENIQAKDLSPSGLML
jgi:hypothetical protein